MAFFYDFIQVLCILRFIFNDSYSSKEHKDVLSNTKETDKKSLFKFINTLLQLTYSDDH